jgi:tRNA-dihydrouridine synthase
MSSAKSSNEGIKNAPFVPFLLAPMAELSHRALRELIEGFGGCDGYYTEMISAAALLGGGPFERWYIDNGPRPEKLVYQPVGADLGQMARAAALLDREECAGIDLNMGCCAPLIRKTGAGIAWMGSIDRAGELVKAVKKQVKRRLSVKIRIGYTDDIEYLTRFCRRIEGEGVEFITLHPRTAKEKLKRLARWQYVGALRQELHIPVAGNGDIASAGDLAARAKGSCDAVMVGRAAVRQPWIFAEAKKVPGTFLEKGARHQTGLRFLELLARFQPPEFQISRAKRFFSFFCDIILWGTYLKNLLYREDSLSGMEQVWQRYFREQTGEK